MSVGGQEIGPTAAGQPQTFTRAHNLRYSSAVNDFGAIGASVQEEETNPSAPPAEERTIRGGAAKRGPYNASEISEETQQRQTQAMKLINEDNPFEKPLVKAQNAP